MTALAKTKVCSEILEIVAEYDRQSQSKYGVDTPGGLEHMGDVWNLFRRWSEELQEETSAKGV